MSMFISPALKRSTEDTLSRLESKLKKLDSDARDATETLRKSLVCARFKKVPHDRDLHARRTITKAIRDNEPQDWRKTECFPGIDPLDEEEEELDPQGRIDRVAKILAESSTAEELSDRSVAKAKALDIIKSLVRDFGPNMGQKVPYDKALAGRLTITKAISLDEHKRWVQSGYLPDHVDTANPAPKPDAWQDEVIAAVRKSILATQPLAPLAQAYYGADFVKNFETYVINDYLAKRNRQRTGWRYERG